MILNLDKLLPEPKEIILGGVTFVVPKMPAKYTLRFAALKEDDSVEKVADILQELLSECTDNPIDKTWLVENASLEEMTQIMTFLNGKDETDSKKNESETLT